MKHIATSLITLFFLSTIHGQAGMWTWMKGSNNINPAGVYGTQGVPSPANNPPGLYEPAEWTDTAGNFWLFGGYKADAPSGWSNDLWKFDPQTNNWAWIKGPGAPTDTGRYGFQGLANI